MFNTLLESRASRAPRRGGSLISFAVHTLIIVSLVALSANAGVPSAERDPVDVLTFAKVMPTPSGPSAPPSRVFISTPVANGLPPLVMPQVMPLDIPSVIPPVDLSVGTTRPDDFALRGVPGGRSDGSEQGAPSVFPTDGAYNALQVEKPVVMLPGANGPAYPEVLRASGVDGMVVAQFVVDTLGRVQAATIADLESTHPLFSAAVRAALLRMRFVPAEVGGRRVAQLVQQPFHFTVRR